MNVGGEAVRVNNLRTRQNARSGKERRITSSVQRDGFIQAVISNAEPPADDQPATELVREESLRTPSETKLRSEVIGRGVVKRSARPYTQAAEFLGTGSEFNSRQVAIFLGDGTEIFPAQ